MTQKQIESRTLAGTTAATLLFAAAGIWAFLYSGMYALFLDGVFSLISFFSSLAALTISKVSHHKTRHYPDGIHFLEPLYAIFKSILMISLMVYSVCSTGLIAYAYFTTGSGSRLNTSAVLPYTLAMVILCFSVAYFCHIQNRKLNFTSTILNAESKTSFTDGLQSMGIGVATLLMKFIPEDSAFGFIHYTGDFFITAALVLLSIKEPLSVLISAFRELSGGTTDDSNLEETIKEVLTGRLAGISTPWSYRILKQGMYITLCIFFSADKAEPDIRPACNEVLNELRTRYENLKLIPCLQPDLSDGSFGNKQNAV